MKRLQSIALLSLSALLLPTSLMAQEPAYPAAMPADGAPMAGIHHPGYAPWGYAPPPMASGPWSVPWSATSPDPLTEMPLPPPSTAYSVEEYRMLLDRRAEALRKQFEQQQKSIEEQQRKQMARIEQRFKTVREWSEQYYAETQAAIDQLRKEHRELIDAYRAEQQTAMEETAAAMAPAAAPVAEAVVAAEPAPAAVTEAPATAR